jgi:predicted DNA binding protein
MTGPTGREQEDADRDRGGPSSGDGPDRVADAVGPAERRARALYAAVGDLLPGPDGEAGIELELTVTVTGDRGPLTALAAEVAGGVELVALVPRADGSHRVGLCVEAGPDAVADAAAALPAVRAVDRDPAMADLALELDEADVAADLARAGGVVRSVRFDGGGTDCVVGLPPGADVRAYVEAVRSVHPETELTARRDRTVDTGSDGPSAPLADLTDRQREALVAAHRAGFFEWPRERTGEDVAESLGVAPPTFHEHLRTGLGRLLDDLLAEAADDAAVEEED